MFKKVIGSMAGLILTASASVTMAGDFDTSQHNFKIKDNKVSLEYRETLDSDKDHLQLGYDIADNVTLEYRYVDLDNIENRFRLNSKLYVSNYLTVGSKLEYRMFQDTDNYYRLIPTFKVVSGNLFNMVGYVNFELRFNFGKQDESNDLGVDATQTKIGFDYNLTDKVIVGPFLQYETDDDLSKTDVFFGTAISVNF